MLLEWYEVIAEHHVDGDGLEELVLDLEVLEVDKLGVVAAGKDAGALSFVHGHLGDRKGEGYGGGHMGETPARGEGLGSATAEVILLSGRELCPVSAVPLFGDGARVLP